MKTISRIDSDSLAKVLCIIYAVSGGIFGITLFFIGVIDGEDIIFNIIMTIGMPILYGILGWVGGYVSAWLYNFVAKRYGGIKFEIE